MIARLLISPSLETRVEEITKILSIHLGGPSTLRDESLRTQTRMSGTDTPPREKLIIHPDVMYFKEDEKLGIEQARKIKEHFSIKPYSAKGRVIVLEDASKLTIEAQNALLKTLEEPPEGAILILAAASDAAFLPTLLSRCEIVNLTERSKYNSYNHNNDYIKKLIYSDLEERFEYIEKLKDKEEFLRSLVAYFHLHLSGVNLNFGKKLLQAEQWAKANVNIRAILEYLMLKLPSAK